MSDVQVRAAVKAQKAAANYYKLTYRGVSYLKSPMLGLLSACLPEADNIGTSGCTPEERFKEPLSGKRGCLVELVRSRVRFPVYLFFAIVAR